MKVKMENGNTITIPKLITEDMEEKLEKIRLHESEYDEKEIIRGLCNCELFQKYVSSRYYIEIHTPEIFRTTKRLIRKRDKKVLAEWKV